MVTVVYDLDGVLNNLNEVVYGRYGLLDKFMRQRRYNIKENGNLFNEEEQRLVLNQYKDINTFKNLSAIKGINKILDIKRKYKDGVKVVVHSLSYDNRVPIEKERFIREHVEDSGLLELNFEVGESKGLYKGADIVVEDSLENIIGYSDKTKKILIDKPYNKFEAYGIDGRGIKRSKDLMDAIREVGRIVDDKYK